MIVNTVRLTAGLAVGACLWLGGAAVSGHGADALGGPADSGTRVTADSGPPAEPARAMDTATAMATVMDITATTTAP